MHKPHSTIVLGDKDNVAIALTAILKDDLIDELGLTAKTDIPKGHKVAKRAIARGDAVFKYGQIIGRSTKAILAPSGLTFKFLMNLSFFDFSAIFFSFGDRVFF